MKRIVFSIIAVALGLTLMEGSFRTAKWIWHLRGAHQAQQSKNELEAYYLQYPWGKDYLVDIQSYNYSPAYRPFEEFRMQPFNGKTIHVQADGFRRVPGQHLKPTKRIEVFGGSTIAGTGSPDEFTIPAQLQILLNADPARRINVVNRGVGAWVFAQEVTCLTQELIRGEIPDEVIFYNGVNDIARAAQNIKPGTTWFTPALTDFFLDNNDLLYLVATQRRWPGSELFGFVAKKLREASVPVRFIPFLEKGHYEICWGLYRIYPKLTEEQKQTLAAATAQAYLQNLRFVEKLAKMYGFKAHFFWQPLLYPSSTHKILTAYEKGALAREPYGYIDLAARVGPLVRRAPLHDLSSCLDTLKGTVFIDGAHLLPTANTLIAQKILEEIKR